MKHYDPRTHDPVTITDLMPDDGLPGPELARCPRCHVPTIARWVADHAADCDGPHAWSCGGRCGL